MLFFIVVSFKRPSALKCPKAADFLIKFLRARKFDQEKAYELLVKYFTFKSENHTLTDNLMPSSTKKIVDYCMNTVFPTTDKKGRRIWYIKLSAWNPNETKLIEMIRSNLLTYEQLVQSEESQVRGVVMIIDAIGVGWSHIKNVDRSYFKKVRILRTEAFPVLVEAMHFINFPAIFSFISSLVNHVINKINLEKHFHGSSLESLQEHFDVSSLPEELGGSLGSEKRLADAWKQHLYSNEEYFKDMTQYKIEL